MTNFNASGDQLAGPAAFLSDRVLATVSPIGVLEADDGSERYQGGIFLWTRDNASMSTWEPRMVLTSESQVYYPIDPDASTVNETFLARSLATASFGQLVFTRQTVTKSVGVGQVLTLNLLDSHNASGKIQCSWVLL